MAVKQAIFRGASSLIAAGMRGRCNSLAGSGVDVLPLVYHVVSDRHVPHVAHLHGYKTVAQFQSDLDFLATTFDPVDPVDLPAILDGQRTIRQPSVLLTFDDGLRELRDIVAPILTVKGIPAIFFVNSAFVDNKTLFFRHKASLLVDECKKNEAARTRVGSVIGKYVKGLPAEQALLRVPHGDQRWLDEAAEAIGFDFDVFLASRRPYLTTEELRQLSRQGFALGAHSRSHPQYGDLPEEMQWEETRTSLDFVKETFDPGTVFFAFPFHDLDVAPSVFARMDAFGVDVSFGTQGFRSDGSGRNVQRLFADVPDMPLKRLIARKCGELMILRAIGKDRIVRHQARPS